MHVLHAIDFIRPTSYRGRTLPNWEAAMADTDVDALRKGLNYGALGFGGLAILAPRVFAAIFGLKGDGNLHVMIRLWGTRTAVLGALGATTTDPAWQRTLATAGTALNAADSVLALKAGSDVPMRSRLMGSATSAAFAAAGGYWLSATG
jgi:hypothetical protein